MEKTETQTAIDTGLLISTARVIDKNPYLIVPEGAKVEDMEKYLDQPTRKRGIVALRDTASFIGYVNAEKTDQTRIYGSYSEPGFVAVINDHGNNPQWRDYRAHYNCPQSVEWKTWKAHSTKQMSQEQFAQFIEDNLPDIATPPAAEMLEISRTLEAKKKVNFASGIRLANGQNELTYEETVSGTAGKGKFQVPELFTIGIPVLEGGQRYAVEARLRYRIAEGGKLTMWYELVRPHKILEDAVNAVWTEIQEKTGMTIFNGGI